MVYVRVQIKHGQTNQGVLKQLRRTTLGLSTHVPLTRKCVAGEIQNLQQKGGKIIQGSGELGERGGRESGREKKIQQLLFNGCRDAVRGQVTIATPRNHGGKTSVSQYGASNSSGCQFRRQTFVCFVVNAEAQMAGQLSVCLLRSENWLRPSPPDETSSLTHLPTKWGVCHCCSLLNRHQHGQLFCGKVGEVGRGGS